MKNDSILVVLGLPRLKILEQQELEDRFEVTVMYRRGDRTCPRCGRITIKSLYGFLSTMPAVNC